MSNISELDAMKSIEETLSKVEDAKTLDRILRWVLDKYGSDVVKEKPSQKTKTKKGIPTKIIPEKFDISGNKSTPSLKAFLKEKKPSASANERILVIGYYITNKLKKNEFSEENIEFAYRVLQLSGRPKHLHQSFIDIRNKKFWIEQGSDTNLWTISRIGEIYVEEKLPAPKKSES